MRVRAQFTYDRATTVTRRAEEPPWADAVASGVVVMVLTVCRPEEPG